jgi:hypothetical protein
MYSQAAHLQKARISLIALAALALAAFAAISAAPRFQVPTTATTSVTATPARTTTSDSLTCGHGAYVTGDMAGDASPSSVYAELCGTR